MRQDSALRSSTRRSPEAPLSTTVLSLPIWLLTILIIVVFVGFAALGLLAARR